jgi:hypothetical protein
MKAGPGDPARTAAHRDKNQSKKTCQVHRLSNDTLVFYSTARDRRGGAEPRARTSTEPWTRLGVQRRRRGSLWPSSPGLLCPGRRRRAAVTQAVDGAGHGFYHYVICIMYYTIHHIYILDHLDSISEASPIANGNYDTQKNITGFSVSDKPPHHQVSTRLTGSLCQTF